jgi:hypothetical protein
MLFGLAKRPHESNSVRDSMLHADGEATPLMGELGIPAPEQSDTEDVHWALTTAASLHARGDHHEALRWLRRAVSAAVASAQDRRAIELGRRAAELEEALGAAPTYRGQTRDPAQDRVAQAPALRTMRIDSSIDGLDEATYVDTPEDLGELPFTQKAAGVRSGDADGYRATPLPYRSSSVPPGVRSTLPEAHRYARDTLTLPGAHIEEEPTVTMKGAPDPDDITQQSHVSRRGSPSNAPADAHTTAPAAVQPRRVAVLASADGEARVIPLAPGTHAPDGAAVALLFPVTKHDAHRIARLLDDEG